MWSVELKNPIPALEVFLRLRQQGGVFWIDRASGERASFMGFSPAAQLIVDERGRAIRRDARGSTVLPGDPLETLATFVREVPGVGETETPRTVGYLSYELGPWMEGRFATRSRRGPGSPLAWLGRYDAVVRCEPLSPSIDAPCRLIVEADDEDAGRRLLASILSPAPRPICAPGDASLVETPSWATYEPAVRRALDYIAAGDVYQVNLAHRFRVRSTADPAATFLRLRAAQSVPYGVFLDCGAFAVLSNSPERFLRVRGRAIRTEPIKGTRRRHPQAEHDAALARHLEADLKERAEHVMIVDLERNDLGRICERGSVDVTSLLRLESFTTVHHLVSTVEGRLRPEVGLSDVLRATFPGGSITGAPKIRASEVIAELEPEARGLYTGALAWFRREDDFDSSIAIRTAVAQDGVYSYFAGGGIVADSDAEREYAECWLKARPFLVALLGLDAAKRCIDAARPDRTAREPDVAGGRE